MTNSSRPFVLIVGVVAALVLAGCQEEERGYLSGRVLVNGEPVGPGTITLQPFQADQAGAMASFGEDGKYEVMSAGRKEGAAVGKYRVLIHGGEGFGSEDLAPRAPSKIPARYSTPQGSNLVVTIEPSSKSVDFELQP